MKLKMHENSLFAILLRSPWWISVAIAAGIVIVARFFLPDAYAFFVGLPFFVIGVMAGWKQPARTGRFTRCRDARVRARDVVGRLLGCRRGSIPPRRLCSHAARRHGRRFELVKAGRTTLVSCKRWKAARTGVEPLRDLDSARRARDATTRSTLPRAT